MGNGKKFRWTSEAQESLDRLKTVLTSQPILAMPQDGEMILDTDASDAAIGAVLSQRQGGYEGVIAYASRRLDRREVNYYVTRKELLAVVHFMRYFRQYLLCRMFLVRTDHSALTWLRRTPEPIGQQTRWLEVMEEFHFRIGVYVTETPTRYQSTLVSACYKNGQLTKGSESISAVEYGGDDSITEV